jgi:NAD(P)H-dependent FMN reductase
MQDARVGGAPSSGPAGEVPVNPTRLLAVAGSTRTASLNKRLLGHAVSLARTAGAEVTHIDLRDFPMPLYDGDLEAAQGLPAPAKAFKRLLVDHPAFLIASPTYNSSVPGVFKNAIDWASRPEPGEPSLVGFKGKIATLLSASPGAWGGMPGLVHLRALLGKIGVLVLPQEVSIPHADTALDPSGRPSEAYLAAALEAAVKRLVEVSRRLAPDRP